MSINNVLSSTPRKMVKTRKPYAFEKAAMAAAAAVAASAAAPIILGQTIEDGVAAFLLSKADKAPKTQAFYAERAKPFLAWCASEEITHCDHVTPGVLDRYKASRVSQGISADTLRSDLLTAVAIVKYDHQSHPNPDHRYRLYGYKLPAASKHQAPTATEGDLHKILRAVKSAWSATNGHKLRRSSDLKRYLKLRDIAIISGMMDTGLRPTALFQLRLRNLHLDSFHIKIERGEGLKNGKESVHPISAGFGQRLCEYLTTRGLTDPKNPNRLLKSVDPETLLFTTIFDGPINAHSFLNSLKRYAARAGVTMNLKMIRHYFASKVVNTGNNGLLAAQELLVHSEVTTTMRYAHTDPGKHRPQHDAAAPFAVIDGVLREEDAPPSKRKSNKGRRVTAYRS